VNAIVFRDLLTGEQLSVTKLRAQSPRTYGHIQRSWFLYPNVHREISTNGVDDSQVATLILYLGEISLRPTELSRNEFFKDFSVFALNVYLRPSVVRKPGKRS